MKTKIPVQELCEKVVEPLGITKIGTDWHAPDGDYLLLNGEYVEGHEIVDYFYSPQGRDLMENEAFKLGCTDSVWLGNVGRYDFDNLGDLYCAGFIGFHKDKHKACLLAFAQLIGVFNPETEEVAW